MAGAKQLKGINMPANRKGKTSDDSTEDYRLLEVIGEGGFGITHKAEHIKTGKLVCLKEAINLDAEDEELLIEEARNMWDLRHYGIPAVRDIIRMPNGHLALVMSYIEGKDLAHVIREHYPNGLDPEHVAWIAERVFNVLKYLHMHGVVHGDMKPQQIMVQPDIHGIVLVDYGLAMVKPKSKDESKGYTPYFCAPEQMEGKPLIPQTDLYGLGMTMIFALGGDVQNVRVPSDTPKEMVKLIKRLIRLDTRQRPEVWTREDLCETIKQVREADFGRKVSGMKPLTF
jgi:serine/threonine protein kinase